jgi:hypothetical protein
VDIAGVRLLGELQRELAARGGELWLAEVHARVRDMVRLALGNDAGEIGRRIALDDAVTAPPAAGA